MTVEEINNKLEYIEKCINYQKDKIKFHEDKIFNLYERKKCLISVREELVKHESRNEKSPV